MPKSKTTIAHELAAVEKNLKDHDTLTAKLNKFRAYEGEDAVITASEAIAALKAEEKLNHFDLTSSIVPLDEIVGSFREGQLIVISAPTGHGKTSFCKTLTRNFYRNNMQSLWFSYEVPPLEFAESFPDVPLYVLPRTMKDGTYHWIEEKVIEGLAKFNSKVVFIDHLHFLIDMGRMYVAKSQSVLIGHIMRELKKIALRYNVVIFLIAHMKKIDLMQGVPTIDDLRDSSFVGQEADIVMMLWRQQMKQTREEKERQEPPVWTNEAILSIVKNRRLGKLGFVKLVYANNQFVPPDYGIYN